MSEQAMATAAPKATKKKAPQVKAAKQKIKAAPQQVQPDTSDGLVVFAFRLTQAERDAIHKTAGPARASRYVRAVAAAFAAEDVDAFKAVLKEAREARA